MRHGAAPVDVAATNSPETLRNLSYCRKCALLFGHPPRRVRVLFQRMHPRLLLCLGQVEPELQQQYALVGQHLLEAQNLFGPCLQRRIVERSGHAPQDRMGVPGAEEHAGLALGRQRPPEPPHRRVHRLVRRRRGKAGDLDMARVHPLVQQIHRLALAAAVDAGDQDQRGEALLAQQVVLRQDQRLA